MGWPARERLKTSFTIKSSRFGGRRAAVSLCPIYRRPRARVVLSDQRSRDQLNIDSLDPRVDLHCGANTVGSASILIPSPGIPPSNPELNEAVSSGLRLMSEIEVAAQFAEAPIVAITGTDGTTTTEMIAAAIRGCGRNIVAGNIGDPFSAVFVMLRVVMFWSSRSALFNFGLRVFSPDVAVITNVAGDHADY